MVTRYVASHSAFGGADVGEGLTAKTPERQNARRGEKRDFLGHSQRQTTSTNDAGLCAHRRTLPVLVPVQGLAVFGEPPISSSLLAFWRFGGEKFLGVSESSALSRRAGG